MPDKTVLQSALESGIYIPHLCYHPDLNPAGECRLCIVEIEGRDGFPTACTTRVAEGMVVKTRNPDIDRIRRLALELMLARHPSECTVCPKYLNCELQSLKQYLGVTDELRVNRYPKSIPVDESHPLFLHDFTRCISCGRCVRACQELRGVQVLEMLNRSTETHVGTKSGLSLADSGCRFCGACVEVCPTGALRDKEGTVQPGKNRRISLIPCRYNCPAEIDVPRYIRLIRGRQYGAATAVIRERVPFPLTLGYVCNHCCEAVCRHSEVNQAISVRELKRFAAENDDKQWRQKSLVQTPSGRQVAVIGSGPTGLTAAFYLAKKGHKITVFESLPEPGGMMRVGIPAYRLPRNVINEEIKEIQDTGVVIKTNSKIEFPSSLLKEGNNAVLLAIGAHRGFKLNIPGVESSGIFDGISFLQEISLGKPPDVGKKVLVLGGGNVAFDCARVARRLGVEEVNIACLEPGDKMLASREEIEQALAEGIVIYPGRTFLSIPEEKGRLTGVRCQEVQSFRLDKEKGLQVNAVPNSEHTLTADTVIFAIGQKPDIPADMGLNKNGSTVQVDPETLETIIPGLFAAGDAVTGTGSVIEAIAAGRKAAAAIDKYLGGNGDISEILAPVEEPSAWLGHEEKFASFTRRETPLIQPEKRIRDFAMVNGGFTEDDASLESLRCLQCDLRFKISPVKYWVDYQ